MNKERRYFWILIMLLLSLMASLKLKGNTEALILAFITEIVLIFYLICDVVLTKKYIGIYFAVNLSNSIKKELLGINNFYEIGPLYTKITTSYERGYISKEKRKELNALCDLKWDYRQE